MTDGSDEPTLARRIAQTARQLAVGTIGKQDPDDIPWNPDSTRFPTREELAARPRAQSHPTIRDAPAGHAWFWGDDDYRGRLNLLTASRVKAAAASEIVTGETARLDLPLNVPAAPAWGRQPFELRLKNLRSVDGQGVAFDDIYHMNTQAGTQWDGFRHVAHAPTQMFYNGTRARDFEQQAAGKQDGGPHDPTADPMKCSIHHWAQAGFCGRAVFLDYKRYAQESGKDYDSSTSHAISFAELEACGRHQGFDIRPESQGGDVKVGDILLIRSGWTQDYYARTAEANAALSQRPASALTWAGLSPSPATTTWLHDSYFAAVAGDAPAFEVWPPPDSLAGAGAGADTDTAPLSLHEHLLALWGVPIGEMLDLERVSDMAARSRPRRSTFFFSSAPFNCPGGVSSFVNATAIF